jgi:hypothetical protein
MNLANDFFPTGIGKNRQKNPPTVRQEDDVYTNDMFASSLRRFLLLFRFNGFWASAHSQRSISAPRQGYSLLWNHYSTLFPVCKAPTRFCTHFVEIYLGGFSMKKHVFILNPQAGFKKTEQMKALIKNTFGKLAEIRLTERAGHATEIARE